MNKISAVIVDDEQPCRDVLGRVLELYVPEVEIKGMAADAGEAFRLIHETQPGLVFLDIQMPRGDGFSLLRRFEAIPFEVIFVTSYDEHAITAIKFNALDYLLKPVDVSDLRQAVAKAHTRKMMAGDRQARFISLQQHLDGDVQDRRFAVHHGEKVKLLPEKDVVYIEADNRYSKIRMNTGKEYVTSRHLKEFEEYFGENSSFARISKTFIINTAYISEYTKGGLFTIEMTDGRSFEVSRRKKAWILGKLERGL